MQFASGAASAGLRNNCVLPTRSATASSRFVSLHMFPQRGVKVNASDLKKNMIVERKDGKLYSVVEYVQITPGRRASIVQVEFKELLAGTKVNERLRSDEKLERVELEESDVEYLEENEAGQLRFRDRQSMEEFEVDKGLLADAALAYYLRPGHTYRVSKTNDNPVRVLGPAKAAMDVVQIKTTGGAGSSSDVLARLNNDRWVKVPPHTKLNSKIWVRLPDEVYMEKFAEGESEEVRVRGGGSV